MSEQVTHILRAMAVNYLRADVFDTLDAQALNKAADLIDALRAEVEALRVENEEWAPTMQRLGDQNQSLRTELEAARGLLESAVVLFACHCTDATAKNWHDAAAAFLTPHRYPATDLGLKVK